MQSLMDNMMKQLLSKDVLFEPMKEIGRRVRWKAASIAVSRISKPFWFEALSPCSFNVK